MENKLKENRITRVDWLATLRAIKVGQSEQFNREEITVSNIRSKASRLKKSGYVFTVKSLDNDNLAIVTREK